MAKPTEERAKALSSHFQLRPLSTAYREYPPMHMSLIVRLALAVMIPAAAFLGFFLHEVIYVWAPALPVIPMAIMGALVVMMWATMDLTDV
jgi:hypothetical protein